MRMIKASCFKLKARFNKLANFNKKITKLHQLFFNYFVNAVEILNVLFLISDSSELSDTKIINNSNIYITDIINLNSSDTAVNLITIISSNSSRKTLIKKIII